MGRLIDADKLKRKCQKVATEAWKMKIKASIETTLNQFIDWIDQAEPVDAVPVQRCDGCRYADWHSNGCIAYCTRHGTDGHVADGFCSEGEKDGEQA